MTKKFRTLDDIQRDREAQEREEFKRDVSGDMKDIFRDIFKSEPPQHQHHHPHRKKKKSKWFFFKIMGFLLLLLIFVNLVLGNIWLIRELVKSLFLGG